MIASEATYVVVSILKQAKIVNVYSVLFIFLNEISLYKVACDCSRDKLFCRGRLHILSLRDGRDLMKAINDISVIITSIVLAMDGGRCWRLFHL